MWEHDKSGRFPSLSGRMPNGLNQACSMVGCADGTGHVCGRHQPRRVGECERGTEFRHIHTFWSRSKICYLKISSLRAPDVEDRHLLFLDSLQVEDRRLPFQTRLHIAPPLASLDSLQVDDHTHLSQFWIRCRLRIATTYFWIRSRLMIGDFASK